MVANLNQQNPNFIFPSVQNEPNPGVATDQSAGELAEEGQDGASTTSRTSNINSVTMSLRSFLHAHPSPQQRGNNADSESPPPHHHQSRHSISGPSLYTFDRRSRDWSITNSDVYRNASLISRPLIEHPDLEKGFQRPKEWGEKTPDLIEAEAISRQMGRVDRLGAERLGKLHR